MAVRLQLVENDLRGDAEAFIDGVVVEHFRVGPVRDRGFAFGFVHPVGSSVTPLTMFGLFSYRLVLSSRLPGARTRFIGMALAGAAVKRRARPPRRARTRARPDYAGWYSLGLHS